MLLDFDMEVSKQLEQENVYLRERIDKYLRVPQRESVYCAGQVLEINIDYF